MSRWIGGLAIAVAAASFAPAPATASHVCVNVEKQGTLGPPLSIGPTCAPIPGHLCDTNVLGLSPTILLVVSFCVPR